MTLPRPQRFSRGHPCPVCGGHDGKPRGEGSRCFGFLSSDGKYAHCTREDHAHGLPLNTDSSTYAHRLDGECGCGVRHLQAPSTSSIRPTSKKRHIAATYDYVDENCTLLFQVVRYQPKSFSVRRPDGKGGWINNADGVRRVLYRLPLVLEAVRTGKRIFLTEGEKDVDAINRLGEDGAKGFVATCNPGGAGKWRQEYSETLRGGRCVLVQDNDDRGRYHARQVSRSLSGVASSCPIVQARVGKDASDHLAEGFGVDDFLTAPEESADERNEQIPVLDRDDALDFLCQSGKPSQADSLIRLVEKERAELFTDRTSDAWVRVNVEGALQIVRCRSKSFRRWLAGRYWSTAQKAANADALNSALNVIEAKARFEGEEHELQNRVALHDEAFWYDLTDRQWRAVRVGPEGWLVVSNPPILFRRYTHQAAQAIPVGGGDLHRLLDFTNLRDEGQRLLLLVYVVACLVPDIPHPILVLHGGQGAAKTTLFRMLKCLVDPSVTETLTMARDGTEFIQQLAHHWMPMFDNLTTLPAWVSDALCRAVTGDGFSKRELFSDDDDVIYAFRRCCGLNGINVAAQRPDLLDRCILLGLEFIEPERRRPEKALWAEFESARPLLFGAALDVLSKAMVLRPSVQTQRLPRMADFALWGCAIAEALDHRQDEFLTAFDRNFQARNQEALSSDPVATALGGFMSGRAEWEGTASELLGELVRAAEASRVDPRSKNWPKAPHALTRRLNEIRHNLMVAGVVVRTGGTERQVTIRRCSGNSVGSVESDESPSGSGDPRPAPTDAFARFPKIASSNATSGSGPSDGPNDATDASSGIPGASSGPEPGPQDEPPSGVLEL